MRVSYIVGADERTREAFVSLLKRDYRMLRAASAEAAPQRFIREEIELLLLFSLREARCRGALGQREPVPAGDQHVRAELPVEIAREVRLDRLDVRELARRIRGN